MADEQKAEPGGRQQFLEPEDALEVEVVRRLVEQQEIGLANQGPRDRQAACQPPESVSTF